MILAIDIGNTNIVLGCMDGQKRYFTERLSTNKTKMEMEYAIDIRMIMEINGVQPEDIEGAIISSVVPPLTKIIQEALYKIIKKEALIVGPGIKNGMNILMDHPAQIGRDLIAVAVGGIAEYKLPLAIFDLGTATTLCVVDEKKNYIGGMIMPGIVTSLNALAENASQLKEIELEPPRRIIGKNTTECMRSGLIYSNAAAMDGILDRVEEEMGQKLTAVATGGLARLVVPFCKRKVHIDEDLLLKGLWVIYNKNK